MEWALNSLAQHGDTDLFPIPPEFNDLQRELQKSIDAIASLDISLRVPVGARRFIVPKDELSFRAATQLSLLDSLLSAAVVHEYGAGIENRRLRPSEKDSL